MTTALVKIGYCLLLLFGGIWVVLISLGPWIERRIWYVTLAFYEIKWLIDRSARSEVQMLEMTRRIVGFESRLKILERKTELLI